ncbi:hypothetical protein GQ55_4G321100 [Panicum hallii var. hallii]|uniref:Transposase (putative) gypsy type domain-containing protein n=1 Tax=Panicum hallii var. hallii TaxID=1504633 RepID=A0A2T7E2B3_9POAL|nr:hypothetical protein GQ55_4G321100 [Panicum hallii var. hallii]
MPSSSSSSVQILDPIPARASGTTPVDTSDSDDDGSCFGGGAGTAPTWPAAGRIASSFRSQKALDALCKKHGVDTREFAPFPAGGRRACSPPPAGAVCVYADALEAGMRVPLHPFFGEVLSHFGLAPSQLAPNCWRVMAAFVALSRAAGARPPSVAVFRHFFALRALKLKGLYCFSSKETAGGVFFTGLPDSIKGWKEGFFFLKSAAPWPCPVLWGEPTKKSTADPMLTSKEKDMVEKLLRVRGAAAIDIRTYISDDGNVAAATTTPCAPKPPPPSPPTTRHTSGAKGMDPSIYDMMQNMRAEKAAAEAAAAPKVAVKSEPGGSGTPSTGKKRKMPEEDNAKEGFFARQDRKPQHAPDRHDGDTVDWEAARQLLQSIVTPARERAFLVANPFNVIASSYVATLQAANYATASFGHALKLQEELEKAKAELAEAKKATAAEVESARAAAVQEFLGSKEHERRLVEEALKGYERGMEDMKRVALGLRPDIDPARLFVPPGGFR